MIITIHHHLCSVAKVEREVLDGMDIAVHGYAGKTTDICIHCYNLVLMSRAETAPWVVYDCRPQGFARCIQDKIHDSNARAHLLEPQALPLLRLCEEVAELEAQVDELSHSDC